MKLSKKDYAILAHVVIDPNAWVVHALKTVGEGAVREKVEKYRDDYLARKNEPVYKTRAEKEAILQEELKLEADSRVIEKMARETRQKEYELLLSKASVDFTVQDYQRCEQLKLEGI